MWKIILLLLVSLGTVPAVLGDKSWLFNQDFSQNSNFFGKVEIEQDKKFPEFFGAKFSSDSPIYRIPSSEQFNYIDDFAVEAVFRSDEINDYRTILWKGDRSQNPQRVQFFVSTINGKLEFKFKDGKGEWYNFITSKPVIFPGLWYRVIVKFKGGYAKIWVNGRECAVGNAYWKATPLQALVKNNDPLYIGSGNYGNRIGMFFCGIIREIRIASPASKLTVDPEKDKKFEARSFQRLIQEAHDSLLDCEKLLKKIGTDKSLAYLKTQKNELDQFYRQLQDVVKNSEYDSVQPVYGKLQRKLDTFRTRLQQEYDKIARSIFFKKLAKHADFTVATLPTGKGFRKSPQAYQTFEQHDVVSMRAARGEVESFQIIPMAGNAATRISIDFSGFISENTGKSLPRVATWGVIRDVTATQTMLGSDERARLQYIGSWPDIVMDGNPASVMIPAEDVTPLLFRVSVPRTAVSGDYEGVITLANASGKKSLTVKLHVYPFDLPERNSIPIAFSFFKHFYSDWFGSLTPEQNGLINHFLLSYRIPPNNIYAGTLTPSIEEQQEFNLNFATAGYLCPAKPYTMEKLNSLVETFRKSLKPLEEAGLAKHTYLYSFDEISCLEPERQEEGFAAARQILGVLKQEFPWLPRVQTSAPIAELLSEFDIWCPTFDYFDPSNQARYDFQKEGIKFWWYSADGPQKPYPNFFLGYPLLDSRVIMTMTYMNKIDGILYWCINREWATNLSNKAAFLEKCSGWKPLIISPFSKQEKMLNGMGNLVYPGPGGIIRPSLRLENLRDGIEDYELYKLLEQRIAKLEQLHSPDLISLVRKAKQVLVVPSSVATSIRSYNHDPRALMKHHDTVGDMIETIDKVLAETK
ncbi:glycoside hydrolase domain-containing protein [Victivallis vadensis]|uniref:glycoside hydrolase domain-containing protein n=2 Tax=Victivallis TaxID=172900 RepID=UPI00307DC338